MAHERPRHLLDILLKRRKLWPVIGLLGPRQVGKSTLLRQQLAARVPATYVTLDRKEHRDRAARSPGYFLQSFGEKAGMVILDEVQKVPDLFDAIKVEVDEQRRPGRFVLSGSTEFSRRTGVRESLTGRIGLTRLYPMTVAELYERPLTAPWVRWTAARTASFSEIDSWLERGGMPGICFLRDAGERDASWEAWLDTTCYRDLQQVHGARLSGDLAREILATLALAESPTIAEVAAKIRVDARPVKKHVEALEALFVLRRIEPHPLGVGKAAYLLFDAGLARHLGASPKARLRIWALNECLAQYEYSGRPAPRVRHYASPKRSRIDLVIEDRDRITVVLLSDEEAPGAYTFRAVHAFLDKAPAARAIVLAPAREVHRETPRISVFPWIAMA